jgi:N6-L-threonylcarbamoyladenine synthase
MLAVAKTKVHTVVLGGGVAANKPLRNQLESECARRGLAFFAAPWAYCTDNAAMIAALGFHQLAAGHISDLALDAHAHSGDALAFA